MHKPVKYLKNTLSIGVFLLWLNTMVHFGDDESYNKTHEPSIKLIFFSKFRNEIYKSDIYDLAYFRINKSIINPSMGQPNFTSFGDIAREILRETGDSLCRFLDLDDQTRNKNTFVAKICIEMNLGDGLSDGMDI
jgi:hypothetical protein